MKLSASLIALALLVTSGFSRTWTSATGTTIEAELVSKNSMGVNLRRPDGKEIFVKLEQLSQEDRDWLESGQEENSGAPNLPAELAALVEAQGSLLFKDDFNRDDADEKDDLGEPWSTNSDSRAMGDKQNDLVEGTLVMTISPRADHAISTNFMPTETYGDCVLFVRMKLEEGGQLKLAYNDKADKSVWAGHINGVTMNETSILLSDERSARFKMAFRENKDSDEYQQALAAAEKTVPAEIEADEWHEVATFHQGETIRVFVNGDEVASHTSPGFDHPTKNHFAFAVPKKAIVDDFYLWKLTPGEAAAGTEAP
ncbi:MAG: LamG-like jellyroll fold domain-containing protein [Verrucomicrobiota bacterium]